MTTNRSFEGVFIYSKWNKLNIDYQSAFGFILNVLKQIYFHVIALAFVYIYFIFAKNNIHTNKKYIHMYIIIYTESIQTPLNVSLFVILQPFAKIICSFFFLINVHTAPHIDRKTQNCWHFCRFIKKEKLKYHMVLSIQTLFSLALNGGGRFLSPSSPLSSLLCSLVSSRDSLCTALQTKRLWIWSTGLLMQ